MPSAAKNTAGSGMSSIEIMPLSFISSPARIYAGYRVLLAIILLAVVYGVPQSLLGEHSLPQLFFPVAWGYLLLTLLSTFTMRPLRRRFPQWAALFPILIDIVVLTLMIHASGNRGQLSVLLMVTVASAGILLPGRGGLFTAAIATLALMFEQFWFSIQASNANPWLLTESGLHGISFFVAAIIIRQIATRLADTEALNRRQSRTIIRLEELNQQIVQRMRTGIIVFDRTDRIVLANRSAEKLLDSGSSTLVDSLVPPLIKQLYWRWRSNPAQHRPAVQIKEGGTSVLVRFANLGDDREPLILVFMEDQRQLAQEAQQLKLVSLGRMSATIAHEIRNPLSAIHHAADLLADGDINEGDKRLVEIITTHAARVNTIISDILDLSRRQASAAELLSLDEMLMRIRQFWLDNGKRPEQLLVQASTALTVRFDPSQLEQILHNLSANAFRHGGDDVTLTFSTGRHRDSELPWLRVSDNGGGIPADARPHLFEPFFTTSHQGTGLGLFVCRELCESNQAQLDLEETPGGASFVITFAHPDRVFQ